MQAGMLPVLALAGADKTAAALSARRSSDAGTAPSSPARPSAAAMRAATPPRAAASAVSPVLDLTPARVGAGAAADDAAAAACKARRVMCAECGADGHWRYDCPARYACGRAGTV
jgi:hypothetical protein